MATLWKPGDVVDFTVYELLSDTSPMLEGLDEMIAVLKQIDQLHPNIKSES
jgi:hypothetical protein